MAWKNALRDCYSSCCSRGLVLTNCHGSSDSSTLTIVPRSPPPPAGVFHASMFLLLSLCSRARQIDLPEFKVLLHGCK